MPRLPGHTGPVSAVAVSPDRRTYASGGYDRAILFWSASAGRVLCSAVGHASLINGLDWSPDGEVVASASSDHTARIWDAATGAPVETLRGHTDDVNTVSWSSDGHRLATASFDGSVRVWSRTGRALLVAAHHGSDVNGVAWLPGDRQLAAASDDCSVSIFDADTGRVRTILRGHRDWVDQVAIHPKGRLLASASLDGTVGIWDLETARRVATLSDFGCVVKDVAWSADGCVLAATSYDGGVRLFDGDSFEPTARLRGEGLWNRTLAFGRRGIVTGSFGGGPVELSCEGTRRFGPAQTAGLNGFAVSPAGNTAAVCSDDGTLYEVDLRERVVQRPLGRHDAAVLCAAFSPCGRYVASGSWDRTLRLWDRRRSGCVRLSIELEEPINTVRFDASGAHIWIGTFNGDVAVLDLESGALDVKGRHQGSVKGMARAAKGVVSVGRDGWVRGWSQGPSTDFQVGEGILNGLALSADGRRIATVSRRRGVELFSERGDPLGRFGEHPCSAKSVAWSHDESRIAASYYDGHVVVWEPESGKAAVRRVSDSSVSQVAFAGGQLIASVWDAHGSLLFLDPESDRREELAVCTA